MALQDQCTPDASTTGIAPPGADAALPAIATIAPTLKGSELRILLYLSLQILRTGQDEHAIPIQQFADEARMARRSVMEAIRSLCQRGLIQRQVRVQRSGAPDVSRYRLTTEVLLPAATAIEASGGLPMDDSAQVARNNLRALSMGIPGRLTVQQWRALKARYGHACLCCGEVACRLIIDHVRPLALGGTNTIDNCEPLCGICNGLKGIRHVDFRVAYEVNDGR